MFRIGHGYDVHRLVNDRKLMLGGVTVPHTHGLLGHSDADVLLHAISDSLLGAIAMGDIGKHFPDNDPAYCGIDSRKLLRHVVSLVHQKGYMIGNVDATVIAQAPRLAESSNGDAYCRRLSNCLRSCECESYHRRKIGLYRSL